MVDAFYTPAMFFYRVIENAHRKCNRTGVTRAGGKNVSFDEYKRKFARFHTRYYYFKAGGIGVYIFGNLCHAKYLKTGEGYDDFWWGTMNLNATPLIISYAVKDTYYHLLYPQGPNCANNLRAIFIGALVFSSFYTDVHYERFLWATYVFGLLQPAIMSLYSAVAPHEVSATKIVLLDTIQNLLNGAYYHAPFIGDLLKLDEQSHEVYMCSLCVHMSTFKFFASVPFAIYNNFDSPFKNTRALVVLPWVLFDFPALVLMLKGCSWDSSLIYGVDTTPYVGRVFAFALAGAAHPWFTSIIPFIAYDLWKRLRKSEFRSAKADGAL